MDDIVDLGEGAMLVGLSETYNFAALDALLTALEKTGADQDIVLDLVPDVEGRRDHESS
ncbi:MAG: hypothetical protein WCD86_21090 [Ktedonobacteraceae bacterium]